MGAVLTQRPELATVVWAGVPFVDALNTMSDPSITYVVYEYPEWGNPLANRLYYESTFPLTLCSLQFESFNNARTLSTLFSSDRRHALVRPLLEREASAVPQPARANWTRRFARELLGTCQTGRQVARH